MLASDFKPGDRVKCIESYATVVSKEAFDRYAADCIKSDFNGYIRKWVELYDYIYVRWDHNGKYDWSWAHHCKLLPSSELAKEASNA